MNRRGFFRGLLGAAGAVLSGVWKTEAPEVPKPEIKAQESSEAVTWELGSYHIGCDVSSNGNESYSITCYSFDGRNWTVLDRGKYEITSK
jgi:hypothetical protein